jgi:hypothetical protein
MIKELDSVILTVDLPECRLKIGDIGTVVVVHSDGAGYEVEFMSLDGQTVAVTTLLPSQIRPICGDADWETESLSNNPKFLAILERSRKRLREEGGISSDEMRRRLGLL